MATKRKTKAEVEAESRTQDDFSLDQASVVRPMPEGASEEGYLTFPAFGVTAYQCEGCRYNTTSERIIRDHVRASHRQLPVSGVQAAAVVPMPDLSEKGGIVRAITDDGGNVTGYEEVKDAKI